MRFIGTTDFIIPSRFGLPFKASSTIGVRVHPGQMAFTRIWYFARSSAVGNG
jgi:hypothetical protein